MLKKTPLRDEPLTTPVSIGYHVRGEEPVKGKMKYRVWWKEEFDQRNAEERETSAWIVPVRRGVLYPEMISECDDVDEAAEEYAEYFHNNRDGWENTWPLEFVVHDGTNYFVVEVEREYDPTFSAYKAKPLKVQDADGLALPVYDKNDVAHAPGEE